MTNDELWLYTLCKHNGISITDIQISRLTHYQILLLEWNKKINLVSRKNEENIWRGHISLSLTMLFKVAFRDGSRILDLGTGGGFPGIPLAILLPASSFVLLDSTQKKITAVQSMADSIGLTNVKTVWGRAEEIQKQPSFSHGFDAVVARSVSNLSNLVVWGMPFLKKEKGKNILSEKLPLSVPSLITFKGAEIEEEEKAAQEDFPYITFTSVPLIFPGSEAFDNLDKKLMIATAT
ncbi:MAG: 16S rRNA (guanine(527)-N(7))-methyltransferase RsmG [Bacteroidota bacterium]